MTYNDPSAREYWVGCYLSDAVRWLPIMDTNEDFVPRLNYSVPINPTPATGMVAGRGLDERLPAAGWRTAGQNGMTPGAVNTPVQAADLGQQRSTYQQLRTALERAPPRVPTAPVG